MCLLTAIHQTLPGCPLLLFGNRDEQRSRTSLSPQIATDERSGVQWLAGTDAKASGTWLGINEYGLVVAVTNRPEFHSSRPSRSRGLLCRDLLACEAVGEAVTEAERQLRSETYSGCNLLLFSGEAAAVIEVGDGFFVDELPPGIHIFGNGPPNDAGDARIRRVRDELAPLSVDVPLDHWLNEARNLCGLHDRDANKSVCRHGVEWGTVSSTIIAVTSNIKNARYLYSDGLPCETPFDDHSPALRTLLAR
jgi:uncharacterized protein with NRDE domain